MSTRECSNWFLRTAHRAIVKEVRWRSMRKSFVGGGAQHLRNPAVAQEVYVGVPAGTPCSGPNPLLTRVRAVCAKAQAWRAPVPVAWLITRPHEQANEEEERDHVRLRRARRVEPPEQDAHGSKRA